MDAGASAQAGAITPPRYTRLELASRRPPQRHRRVWPPRSCERRATAPPLATGWHDVTLADEEARESQGCAREGAAMALSWIGTSGTHHVAQGSRGAQSGRLGPWRDVWGCSRGLQRGPMVMHRAQQSRLGPREVDVVLAADGSCWLANRPLRPGPAGGG
eukprot:CAMPEP_0185192244 /NCGR_PEP_ID=MMETSP1140-20130426/17824_1 /TAXON_ID=298111 /ORGANISM="Pavlova sp., Strain CCMP459" /LENGTH=159 /DNA_ID=CAMNT_0027758979 /DNA_START=475 /DNA_END=952 /DNA_ORIENTATION=+